MSALGQKPTCAAQKGMSALHLKATVKADIRIMSALHPIADMCGATAHVRFGPIADIATYSIISLMSNLKTAFDETIANKYFKLGVWLAPQQ